MKVIIVEDEFLAQQELSWLIKEHSQMEIVGTFDDGLDVLKFLQHNRVDAIFLDINIPSLDGVLLAQNISQFAHKPFIVFITAWKEHAVEAFELEAFDYILKPYQESRITGMLQKLEAAWCLTRNYWGASGLPASLPRYRWAVYVLIFPVWISCCAANTATCWKQSSSEWWKEKCCLFRHARLIYRSTTNR